MNRWKVESTVFGDSRLWLAFELDQLGRWWYQRGEFDTHVEALTYADCMARTVEVELPRVNEKTRLTAHNGTPGGHPSGYAIIRRNEGLYCSVTLRGPWGECGIFDEQDIKPLALALLAHHYQQEQQ